MLCGCICDLLIASTRLGTGECLKMNRTPDATVRRFLLPDSRMFVNPAARACAKAFRLVGTERMPAPHSCFPSDHFGIDCMFEL